MPNVVPGAHPLVRVLQERNRLRVPTQRLVALGQVELGDKGGTIVRTERLPNPRVRLLVQRQGQVVPPGVSVASPEVVEGGARLR